MATVLTNNEQNLRLVTAYLNMNDEGRNVLDKAIQQLAETSGSPEKIRNSESLAFFESFKSKKAHFRHGNAFT